VRLEVAQIHRPDEFIGGHELVHQLSHVFATGHALADRVGQQ
jgi:hypothetical protein